VRADIERFGIDKLIAADPGGHAGRPCAFAVQVPELGSVGMHGHDYDELGYVAAVGRLSPHRFSEQFRRATGGFFQSHVKRRRPQFARALLDSTELGVTEVGHAAGFNGPSSFGRADRARYGVSPSGRCRAADDRSPLGNERVSPLTSAKRSDDASRKPIDLHVASPTRSRPDQGNSHG
jgi:AraC-like DNA-binding protein